MTFGVMACLCFISGIPKPSFALEKPLLIQTDRFLDRARFDAAARSRAVQMKREDCEALRGGLVNHHALASDLLQELFQTLRACRPDLKRIIILSPDHFFQGRKTITTGSVSYVTDGNTMTTDQALLNELLRKKIAVSDPKLFRKEHGIGTIMPFLSENYPDIQFLPIVIRSDVSLSEANRLATFLRDSLDDKTFLLVSSDMSHYLPERVARQKDRETLRAFETNDRTFFWKAKDDHLDFGKGVRVALQVLESVRFERIGQSISTSYGGPTAYTTTYFTGFWIAEKR